MTRTQRIQIVESFYTGSHRYWADAIVRYSSHQIDLNTLPGRHWKWRLSSGCINLAGQVHQFEVPDLFVLSSMVDLCAFRALLPIPYRVIPMIYYFHENQIGYPGGAQLERDRHYGMIQFKSALAADALVFNSAFHRDEFLRLLPEFLAPFPDRRNTGLIGSLKQKSEVLYPGIETPRFERKYTQLPIILWNHRWEQDKNPELFFRVMDQLRAEGINYRLVLCGEHFSGVPKVFSHFIGQNPDLILHCGYADCSVYGELMSQAAFLPVTAVQEYFGISVMEAIAHGVIPLLPEQLVYPELYGKHKELFYRTEEELFKKLRGYLRGERLPLIPNVEAFYWPEQIRIYDQYFNQFL